MFASLFITTGLAAAMPMATAATAQSIVDERSGGEAGAVNRLVGGIISYVRWPDRAGTDRPSLCVVGRQALAGPLRPLMPGDAASLRAVVTSVNEIIGGQQCDIVYLGSLPDPDRRRLIAWVFGRAVLTITDADPACQYGAAVCLFRRGRGIAFSLNMDAVARSKLRVDPRVLQLGGAAS